VLAVLLFVSIALGVVQMNARPLLADIAARSATRYARNGAWGASIAAAEQAVAYWPVEPAHHLLLSQSFWRQAVADPAAAHTWLSQAASALQAARQLRPEDPVLWLQTAQFYTSAAGHYGSDARALAGAAYQQAVALAPHHATIYTAWGRAYLEQDNPEAAAPLLRKAVILDASHGEAYIYLGAAELALGRLEIALADYHEAVRLLPTSSRAYAGLAACYWQLERPHDALLAVEKALERDPHNAQALSIRREIGNAP
jgi:tetratricopeptide (TPR) repeat protein